MNETERIPSQATCPTCGEVQADCECIPEPESYIVGRDSRPPASRIVEYHGDGESYTVYEVLYSPSLKKAKKWTEEERPSTRCIHAWDCCGHFYAYSASVRRIGMRRFIIEQTWSQNI